MLIHLFGAYGVWAAVLFVLMAGGFGTSAVIRNRFDVSLGASFEIDLWGRLRYRLEAAALDAVAARRDAESLAITIAAEVTEIWATLAAEHDRQFLLKEQIQVSAELLELIELHFERGMIPASEVMMQEQELSNLHGLLILNEAEMVSAANQLAILLGEPPRSEMTIRQKTLPSPLPVMAAGVPSDVLEFSRTRYLAGEGDYLTLLRNLQRLQSLQMDLLEARRRLFSLIVEVNPRLVLGGLLNRDEMLVRIEEDFRFAVEEAYSALIDAQNQLALEKGRQGVAREEWQRYMERYKVSPAPETVELALRQPQLQALQAKVEAAKAGLERASLNLERTVVRFSFDAVVLGERAAVGQLANPQQVIAELVDSSVFWVLASIPSNQIQDIAIPGINAAKGSRAVIQQDLGLTERRWQGRSLALQVMWFSRV